MRSVGTENESGEYRLNTSMNHMMPSRRNDFQGHFDTLFEASGRVWWVVVMARDRKERGVGGTRPIPKGTLTVHLKMAGAACASKTARDCSTDFYRPVQLRIMGTRIPEARQLALSVPGPPQTAAVHPNRNTINQNWRNPLAHSRGRWRGGDWRVEGLSAHAPDLGANSPTEW